MRARVVVRPACSRIDDLVPSWNAVREAVVPTSRRTAPVLGCEGMPPGERRAVHPPASGERIESRGTVIEVAAGRSIAATSRRRYEAYPPSPRWSGSWRERRSNENGNPRRGRGGVPPDDVRRLHGRLFLHRLGRGVFANAQTGNVVLLGIHLADGAWRQAGTHLPPILAFFTTAVATRRFIEHSRIPPGRANVHCPAAECVGVLALGVLGGSVPDGVATVLISAFAAVQCASFGKVADVKYSSAMMTGNLQSLAFLIGASRTRRQWSSNRGQMLTLAAICSSFLAGAFLGCTQTRLWSHNALLAALPLLVLATVLKGRAEET